MLERELVEAYYVEFLELLSVECKVARGSKDDRGMEYSLGHMLQSPVLGRAHLSFVGILGHAFRSKIQRLTTTNFTEWLVVGLSHRQEPKVSIVVLELVEKASIG